MIAGAASAAAAAYGARRVGQGSHNPYGGQVGGYGQRPGYGYGHGKFKQGKHGGKFKQGKHGKHGKRGKHGMFGGGGKFKKWK